ncbi:MAG: D-alanyl-D-alanine carboxypeptidase [candidate division BRC1 bacterium ADurb.BinA364]|nr:MAG: D-alanyl-D-alanine carboxypeptidase [candidate division BRC1 bacterium ADurb.BinA364]
MAVPNTMRPRGFACLAAAGACLAVFAWSAESAIAAEEGIKAIFPQNWTFFGEPFAARLEPGSEAAKSDSIQRQGGTLAIAYRAADREGAPWLGWMQDGRLLWIPEALAVWVAPQNLAAGNLPYGEEVVDRWRALPLEYQPDDLEPLPAAYRYEAELEYPLRREAREMVLAMIRAAQANGAKLQICSGYRSAAKQRELYLRKIESAGYGQKTVAKPGHSEHQLGAAIDFAGPDDTHLLRMSFGQTREGQWLASRAAEFGFVQSYTEANEPLTGYQPEPWHYRYVGIERARGWRPLGPPCE